MEFDLMQYYCRERFYHKMQNLSSLALKRTPNDFVSQLQHCISLIMQAKFGESIRLLEPLVIAGSEVALPGIIALMHAHNQCEVPDNEELISLESKLRKERIRANENSLFYSAYLYLHLRNFEKAQEYGENISRLIQNSEKSLLIKGWVEFHNKQMTKAEDSFKKVLLQNNRSLDAYFGEISSVQSEEAINLINQLIIKYPRITPPLIEKMKLYLSNRNWNQALETASKILEMDFSCIPALQMKIFFKICVNGDYESCVEDIKILREEFQKQEPDDCVLTFDWSIILSRISARNEIIVKESICMIENMMPNLNVLLELAYQYYLIYDWGKATELYKRIIKIDDSSNEALIGLTFCRMSEVGITSQVQQQIEYLSETVKVAENPQLLLLQSKLKSPRNAEKLIDKAIEVIFDNANEYKFGFQYFTKFDANFILQALSSYPSAINNHSHKIEILQRVVELIPGLSEAWLMLAKIHIEIGNNARAEDILNNLYNNLQHTSLDASLMLAHVLVKQGKYKEADNTLEICLSQNLNVTSKALYHFLAGVVYYEKKEYEKCVKAMENALDKITDNESISEEDLSKLYVSISESYGRLNKMDKAEEIILRAKNLFESTKQEDTIVISYANLAYCKGDVPLALSLLVAIPSSRTSFPEARKKMAEIYLKENNKSKFVECYQELADSAPNQENFINLAEAYFTVRDVNKSIETYEYARKQFPNAKLSCKLAELYVKCHQYGKAIRYYRESGPEGSKPLAELLVKLNQLDVALSTLSDMSTTDKALILSKIKEKSGDIAGALEIVKKAYEQIHRTDTILLTRFCRQIAEYESNLRNFEEAVVFYKSALSYCEGRDDETEAIQIALAKLYLQINEWNICNNICTSLLSKNGKNETAILISADLAFRKCDLETACELFGKLLQENPTHWLALARYVEIKRRMAAITEAKEALDIARTYGDKDPLFIYCLGLYKWYNNEPNEAIKCFTYVKNDPEWGPQAIHNILELYLANDEPYPTMQALVQEIHPSSIEEETNRKLLVNFVLLASKDKALVEKAMNDLTLLATQDYLRVGASLGLAIGYLIQKQAQRTRNVLKIVAKTSWQFEEAEYLERCWLMLADHYIQSGKHEHAAELLRRVLTHNQASVKAHEYFGLIAEKDQKPGEASAHYERAWSLSGKNDGSLGYRLAITLFKCKRLTDSIDTCRTVMKLYPNHTKIRKDIYEKAIAVLRT